MNFTIRAKYQELIDLRNQMGRLKEQLVDTSRALDTREFQRLEGELSAAKGKAEALERELAVTADTMRGDLGEALSSARRRLNDASDVFRVASARASHLKGEWEKAKKALADATAAGAAQQQLAALSAAVQSAERAFVSQSNVLAAYRANVIDAESEVGKFSAAMRDFEEAASPAGRETADAGAAIEGFAAKLAGLYGVKKFVGDIVSARMEMQNMQTTLETMVGKETAASLFDQLFTLAKKSPLEMSDMVGAEQMMISFGIGAQDSIKYLNALSDISMGEASKFNSLTLAFSQMSATGKLMGQDLNQMINQGFNPLEAISDKTGKSIAQLKDEMSKGLITAEMVQQAFIDVTQEGGRFYNMSEAASKTIQGQISMFEDALSTMYNSMGEALEGVVMDSIKAATALVENWREMVPLLLAVAGAVGTAKAALVIHTTWQKAANVQMALNNALQAKGRQGSVGMAQAILRVVSSNIKATAAQTGLNAAMAACPYVLIGAAVAGLCLGIYKYATSMTEAEKSHERLNKAMAEADKEADKEIDKLQGLADTLATLGEKTGEYAAKKKEIVGFAREYNSALAEEIEKNGLTEESYTRLSDKIQAHYRVKAYLRWKDSEEARRQELIQERMAKLRELVQERYIDTADTDEDRYSRSVAASRAMGELSRKLYSGEEVGRFESVKGTWMNNGSLSKEANALFKSIDKEAGFYWGAIQKRANDIIDDVNGLNAELASDMNKSLFGIGDEDLENEKKRQEDEKKRKEEEAKKKKKAQDKSAKAAEAKKKADKNEAARRKLEADFTSTQEKVSGLSGKGVEDTLDERRKAIQAGYDALRQDIKEREAAVEAAVKKGVISKGKGEEYKGGYAKARAAVDDAEAREAAKLYADYLKQSEKELVGEHEKYEARRLEISRDFAKRRADLETIASSPDAKEDDKGKAREQLANLDSARKAELAKVDYEEFKAGEEYAAVFRNLESVGITTLTVMKRRLEQFGDTLRESMSPSDVRAFEETLRGLDERVAALDPFEGLRRGREEYAEAMERKGEAVRKVTAALRALESVEGDIAAEEAKTQKDGARLNSLYDRRAKAADSLGAANAELAAAEEDAAAADKKTENAKARLSEKFKELEGDAKAVTEALGADAGNVYAFIENTVTLVNTCIDGIKSASTAATAALKAVETASVILAIIGAALQVVQALRKFLGGDDARDFYDDAVERQKEVNRIASAVRDYERAVREARAAEEDWFSSSSMDSLRDQWALAADALDAYRAKAAETQVTYKDRQAGRTGWFLPSTDWSQYNVTYSKAVDNLRFETRARKHGTWFRKGHAQETVDLRDWAKENFGSDLFDASGMIDVDMAQEILDNYGDKLVGETKETLERLKEEAEAYNEAVEGIQSAVSDMYSPLVDNMTDAVWNWLETGESALDTFRDSASETFASIAQDMIKTMANKLIFSKFDEQIEELATKYAKNEIDEEELMRQSLALTDETMRNSEAAISTIQAMAERVSEAGKELGYDMTGVGTEVSASGGGFETMSEDTATELSGRFTALYESGLRREAQLSSLTSLCDISAGGFERLAERGLACEGRLEGISECLAQSCLTLQEIKEGADKQVRALGAIQSDIEKIRKATDNF